MNYLDFGHSVVSTSRSVSAAGVQRDPMIPGSSTREVCSGFYTYMSNEPLHTCASGVKQLVCLCVCQCVSVLDIDFWADTTNQTILRDSFAFINNTKLPEFCVYFRITPHYVTTQLPTFLCVLLNYTCCITTQWMYLHTLYQTWSHQSLETLISDCVVLDILHKIEGFCVLYWKLWSDFPCKQPGLVWI